MTFFLDFVEKKPDFYSLQNTWRQEILFGRFLIILLLFSRASANKKPKVAPMMAKTLKLARGLKGGFRRWSVRLSEVILGQEPVTTCQKNKQSKWHVERWFWTMCNYKFDFSAIDSRKSACATTACAADYLLAMDTVWAPRGRSLQVLTECCTLWCVSIFISIWTQKRKEGYQQNMQSCVAQKAHCTIYLNSFTDFCALHFEWKCKWHSFTKWGVFQPPWCWPFYSMNSDEAGADLN